MPQDQHLTQLLRFTGNATGKAMAAALSSPANAVAGAVGLVYTTAGQRMPAGLLKDLTKQLGNMNEWQAFPVDDSSEWDMVIYCDADSKRALEPVVSLFNSAPGIRQSNSYLTLHSPADHT